MDIFSKIKQEKSNLIDPIDLFTELSNLINEPITIVATAFIRLNNEKASVNIYSYEYDPVNGIKKSPYNHENFIEAIVNGYERVIITDEIDDHWVGFWGLSKNGQLDYDINGINAFRPFYFIREEVNDFLNLHSIPLPPCITKKVINNINDDCVNNNNKHPQQINQLEQKSEEQKKINSESVYIPPLDIIDTGDLTEEINQLKLDNQKLTEQLNEAKKEIEELKNNHSQNLNDQLKKESPKTINAQAKFIKALLHHYYGEGIANNPRPHIENKDGEIKRDFETQGLSKNLPTGVVVKKWVDSIELEIDS